MAKESLITRTVTTTIADVYCVDIDSKEGFNTDVILPGKYKSDEALFKAVQKSVDTPNVKALSIESKREETAIRAVKESWFIDNSFIITRGSKNTATEEAENL
ncbi:MAG: hypothetical protein J6S67_03575 [Methanobrevibacter sp.]|nr:hypothetical protein [Methanobrevibacter sp.]